MGEDPDTGDLMDIFSDVDAEDTIIGILSRRLSDVPIQSLLEQTREIVGEIDRRR